MCLPGGGGVFAMARLAEIHKCRIAARKQQNTVNTDKQQPLDLFVGAFFSVSIHRRQLIHSLIHCGVLLFCVVLCGAIFGHIVDYAF